MWFRTDSNRQAARPLLPRQEAAPPMTPDKWVMPAMTEVNLSNHNDRTLGPATRTVDSHYVGPSSTWPPNRPAGFVASGAYPDPYEAGSRPNENSRYGAYPDPYEAGSRPNENSRYEKDKITREQVAQLMGLRSQYSPQCRGDWVLQAFQRR